MLDRILCTVCLHTHALIFPLWRGLLAGLLGCTPVTMRDLCIASPSSRRRCPGHLVQPAASGFSVNLVHGAIERHDKR